MGNFVVPSGDNTSGKKYFESRKSPTSFNALISEEHFGQISLKSGKSTYPINSFHAKTKAVFSALKQKDFTKTQSRTQSPLGFWSAGRRQ